MNSYEPGSQVTLSVAFTNAAGQPAAPTTVKLRVLDPTGAETDYTGDQLTNGGTGLYSAAIAVAISGNWRYRWEATGSVIAAQDGAFRVLATAFGAD